FCRSRGRLPAALCAALLLILLLSAGCTTLTPVSPSYQVDSDGRLQIHTVAPSPSETIITQNTSYTLSRIMFHNVDEDIYALLAVPENPKAAILLAPGAGVKKEAHESRAVWYAEHGYAFMVLDIRGNGGETAGRPLDFNDDYNRYARGAWPEYYKIVSDLSAARILLEERLHVPVYAMGSSNGGRYAAIAASIDDKFAGYIGVSTSGFGLVGNTYSGDARKFLLSIDPDASIASISPRSVYLFHAPADTIIPIADGLELFSHARDPKTFTNFTGSHGLNGEVDGDILALLG
ncbi:MAG TPA: alpha/beta hydrolase, partial [Methanomicrobiales archaeon]|nr:alpha/beta hydrolase [Methanomicrobiales archaeon]